MSLLDMNPTWIRPLCTWELSCKCRSPQRMPDWHGWNGHMGNTRILYVWTGPWSNSRTITNSLRIPSLQAEPGNLSEIELFSRWQKSIPLEKMTALERGISSIIPCYGTSLPPNYSVPRLHPQISRNFLTQSWQPYSHHTGIIRLTKVYGRVVNSLIKS